jgi:ParB family transcriptional regulator, chromosome partitioning protein
MTTTHHASTSVPITTNTPRGYALRSVDPATLLDNPNNARRPHRDRDGLAPSIGALGILNPLLVRQLEDGRLEIIAGERRKYSAIKAGLSTIPVFVRDDLSPLHQIAGMLVENHDRDGLSPTEEAVAIAQLAGFEGTTQRDITSMTGIKAGVVRSALKVAASEVATAIGERHDLNLDQLMVLAEFDADTEAVKELTVTALKDPNRFDHVVAQLRRDRDDRAAYEIAGRQVTDSGVSLVELENGCWLPDGAAWLSELVGPDGSGTLTPGKHRKCPGHAGAVREAGDGCEVAYLCLDPVGEGHIAQRKDRLSATEVTSDGPGMTDEQKAERRHVVANNKAWEVATPVRRTYVTGLLARRSVPKGMLRYVTDVIMADPAGIAAGDGDQVAALIGKETHPGSWDRTAAITFGRDTIDSRLPLVLLAQVAASVEARFGERQGWRRPAPALGNYLRFLASCGYGLSEVEQEVAKADDE